MILDPDTYFIETRNRLNIEQPGELSPLRVIGATVLGAAAATFTIWLEIILGFFLSGDHVTLKDVAAGVSTIFVFFFLIVVPVMMRWLAGIVVVGLPCWWLLHKAGYRGPVTAAALGLILTSLFLPAVFPSTTVDGFSMIVPAGVVAALVIWRVAYRRPFWPPSFLR